MCRRLLVLGLALLGVAALISTDRVALTTDDGYLKTVSGPGGTATYTRDPAGRPTALSRGNGTWTSWGYDRVGRTSSVAHGRGSTETSRFAYAYDAVGNPTSISTPEGTNTFRYDAQDRLTAECYVTPCGIGSVPTSPSRPIFRQELESGRLMNLLLSVLHCCSSIGEAMHTHTDDDRPRPRRE